MNGKRSLVQVQHCRPMWWNSRSPPLKLALLGNSRYSTWRGSRLFFTVNWQSSDWVTRSWPVRECRSVITVKVRWRASFGRLASIDLSDAGFPLFFFSCSAENSVSLLPDNIHTKQQRRCNQCKLCARAYWHGSSWGEWSTYTFQEEYRVSAIRASVAGEQRKCYVP